MVPPSSHEVSRVPRYFGYSSLTLSFAYVTLTLFGTFSHTFQLEIINTKCCPKPHKYCYLWFSLFRFRSPLLTEYPFLQVLRCFTSLRTPRPKPVPTHDGRWVPPFGNPRIKALLAAPRGISQPQTSFIGPVCQGIHHTPLQATHTTKVHGRKIPLANSQTTNHHTKNDHKTIETNNRVRFEINSKTKIQKLLFCSRPLSSSQATTHRHAIAPAHGRPPGTTGIESRQAKSLGWRSGSPKAHPYHPGTHRTTGRAKPTTSSTPATPPPSHHATRGAHTVGRTSD